MKRNYQGYSGAGQANPNPPPNVSYPPLPSGQPPPQPSSNASVNQQNPSPNTQYQLQPPPTGLAASQTYPYSSQYAAAAGGSYAQYPGYSHPQPATVSYPPSAYNTLPPNPQQQHQSQQHPHHQHPQMQQPQIQQQQQPQQQQQQPQHPAYANYGYGAPSGPQQPPKVSQPYHAYPPPNTNQLPANPNPSIPANPYTGYPPTQINAPGLQNSPGSAAPPPYKRPRYESNPNGATFGSSNQQNPYSAGASQQTPNNLPPALPPLRNNNGKNNQVPSGTMRIGASTNNTRGGFSGGRSSRSGGGPYGNNSPIRLNLGPGGGTGSYDGGSAPHYDASLSHPPQPMSHPLPAYHQSPQSSNTAPHYLQSSFNNPDTHYPHYPSNMTYPPGSNNDLPNPPMGGNSRGLNDSMRSNNFPSDFGSGSAAFNHGPSNQNEPFHLPMAVNQANHGNNSHRSNRGGFRGNTGNSMSGGRGSRERGNDMGDDGMTPRGNRGYAHQSFGSSNKSDRHGSNNRSGRSGNQSSNNRHDDHGSSYSGTGPGGSRHAERSGSSGMRGQRNISNLPTLAGGLHKGNQHHDRRGGNNRSSGGPMGDRNSGNRGGRRNNGRDAKFDDRKNSYRSGGRNSGPGSNSANGPGADDKQERTKQNAGPPGIRVKNGWGAQFKEFNEREKEKEKTEETAPTRRTLTDFRINALEIPDLSWSWVADNPDAMVDLNSSAIVLNLEETQNKSSSQSHTATTTNVKHGRDEEADSAETGKVSTSTSTNVANSASTASATGTKKLKSDESLEAKKIYEEAASAVKGLNLTVDEQSSDHEDNNLDEEIKDQLVSGAQTNYLSLREKHAAQPQTANAPQSASEVQDGESKSDPKEVSTTSAFKKENGSPPPVTTNANSAAISIQPTTPTNVPPVLQPQTRDRAHPYSKPTLPAGRENSRLRLYFSSPPSEGVVAPNPLGLPNKPVVVVSGVGKRKLSISGHSAMSVDTKFGGGGAPGSSPMTIISPNKAPSIRNSLKTPKENISEANANLRTLGSTGEPAVKESPKPEEQTASASGPSQFVESKRENNDTVTDKEANSKSSDSKPDNQEESRLKQQEHATGEEPPRIIEINDEDADGDYEEEEEDDDEDDEYESPPAPEPQADRLSISYARNTRRMVIDSNVVESIKVFRSEHKVEVLVRLLPAIIHGGKFNGAADVYRICKGVLVEALDQEIDDYVIIDRATLEATWIKKEQDESKAEFAGQSTDADQPTPSDGGDEEVAHDPLLPPLHRLFLNCLQPATAEPDQRGDDQSLTVTAEIKSMPEFKQNCVLIVAKLDTANPLTEAKWVRTGDVDSWISQMTGRIFKPEDKAECGWRRKITVVDPDPPPTIQHLLDTWLTTSGVGSIDTRQRFIDRHVSKNVDVIIEILLRVIRSGNSSAMHHHTNPAPLIVQQAATLHAPYPEQQTQVTLAVLGLYRLSIETAIEAGMPVDKVIKKATDIVRSLPYRLAFSALDGIYKDEHPN